MSSFAFVATDLNCPITCSFSGTPSTSLPTLLYLLLLYTNHLMDQPKKQRGGRKRNSKAKAEKDEPKIPRPYTSWLIYFQLEREWILQKKLGVASSLDPEKAFVAADPRYNGPPLPSRYQDLTLPSDWWMPGKGDRRKRLHRKVRLQSFRVLNCVHGCVIVCHFIQSFRCLLCMINAESRPRLFPRAESYDRRLLDAS